MRLRLLRVECRSRPRGFEYLTTVMLSVAGQATHRVVASDRRIRTARAQRAAAQSIALDHIVG